MLIQALQQAQVELGLKIIALWKCKVLPCTADLSPGSRMLLRTDYTFSYSVFPRHCFSFKSARVISLSGVQLSGFIHLSHVKNCYI